MIPSSSNHTCYPLKSKSSIQQLTRIATLKPCNTIRNTIPSIIPSIILSILRCWCNSSNHPTLHKDKLQRSHSNWSHHLSMELVKEGEVPLQRPCPHLSSMLRQLFKSMDIVVVVEEVGPKTEASRPRTHRLTATLKRPKQQSNLKELKLLCLAKMACSISHPMSGREALGTSVYWLIHHWLWLSLSSTIDWS